MIDIEILAHNIETLMNPPDVNNEFFISIVLITAATITNFHPIFVIDFCKTPLLPSTDFSFQTPQHFEPQDFSTRF
jgi:hypothetical protein